MCARIKQKVRNEKRKRNGGKAVLIKRMLSLIFVVDEERLEGYVLRGTLRTVKAKRLLRTIGYAEG